MHQRTRQEEMLSFLCQLTQQQGGPGAIEANTSGAYLFERIAVDLVGPFSKDSAEQAYILIL